MSDDAAQIRSLIERWADAVHAGFGLPTDGESFAPTRWRFATTE